MRAREPIVSVVVPVRDNAAGIAEVVRRLAAQTIPRHRFEVIVGDDGSRNGSLADLATGDGWVRVVAGPPRTSYSARNQATRSARGSVLAFCDSDCLPEPTWLEEGLAALEHADVVAGDVRFVAPPRPSVWSLLTIDMFLDQGRNVLLSHAATANLFVSHRLFDVLGGFDDSLPSGGDYDFALRSVQHGARLGHAPAAIVRHPTLDSRGAFLHKIWATNRWSAVRRARAGGRPGLADVLTFVPILGAALARRHALRSPWKLQRRRLEAAGLTPGVRDDLRALPVVYFLVAYVAGLARIHGWFAGRRLARAWADRAREVDPGAAWLAMEAGSLRRY